MDLTDFLLARIAEDEEVARKGTHRPCGAGGVAWLPGGTREHVLNWGPFRVLAECDAKRRIVAEHSEDGGFGEESGVCTTCNRTRFPCPTLRLLALPYADHPDYREEWRP